MPFTGQFLHRLPAFRGALKGGSSENGLREVKEADLMEEAPRASLREEKGSGAQGPL